MEFFKQTLRELQISIIILGILNILIGMWFPKEMLPYVLGGVLGTVTSLVMADHMARTIVRAVADDSKASTKFRIGYFFRYALVAVVLVVAFASPMVNGIAAFIGIISLKFATYLTPLVHKINLKINPKALETDGSEDMEEVEDDPTVING